MDTCQWCGQQLVEVDNPMRREMRHKRGEEANCPGPPNSATGPPINYAPEAAMAPRPTRAQAIAGLSDPPALAACPICGETWWLLRRAVRIAVAEFANVTGTGAEPVHHEHRTQVMCAGCGYSPPGS